jgi:hypothetical protein
MILLTSLCFVFKEHPSSLNSPIESIHHPQVALKLRQLGIAVTLITPASLVGGWHSYTDDQAAVMRQLIDARSIRW